MIISRQQQLINNINEFAYLNLPNQYYYDENVFNPLASIPKEYEDAPELYITFLMSRPEYFYFICDQVLNLKEQPLLPSHALAIHEMWHRKFPMLIASRGWGKSTCLGRYALLRCLLQPNRKIVVCGAGFRQSKVVFEYIESIWNNAPILKDLAKSLGVKCGPSKDPDMWRFHIGNSTIVALPVGDGEKIRGQRGNDLLVDEFKTHNPIIFDTVMKPMAAVNADPLSIMNKKMRSKIYSQFNMIENKEQVKHQFIMPNQIVLSGTPYYRFNHFYKYYQQYHDYISTCGDADRMQLLMDKYNNGKAEKIKWDDYSIIRIPVELAPEGFVDEDIVLQSKLSIGETSYNMEYGAIFPSDSEGFFKRSSIEAATPTDNNPVSIALPNDAKIEIPPFTIKTKGDQDKTYIFGIDPASEVDNFAITILEATKEFKKIVYCWTMNKKKHQQKIKAGLDAGIDITKDYFAYCTRKIRDLLKSFNCGRIAIDSQGGGYVIIDSLHNKTTLEDGEQLIWEIIDEQKQKVYDDEDGLHILEPISFASAAWTSLANNKLKQDIETKRLTFPFLDGVKLAEMSYQVMNNMDETFEDCSMEIEELKNELSCIQVFSTGNRQRWDAGEMKEGTLKKSKYRKDRYSSLLMANYSADEYFKESPSNRTIKTGNNPTGLGIGPAWYNTMYQGMSTDFGNVY